MNVSLAGWSLNRRFRGETEPLQLLDFPRVAREEFDIDAIELNDRLFASTDRDYLKQLQAAAAEYGVALVGMACDTTGSPASLDEGERLDAVRRIQSWFPIAAELELPFFRVNTGGRTDENYEQHVEQCITSFKVLMQDAEGHGVRLAIENHGGIARHHEGILALIEGVDSPWLGTLPDFGNFDDESRYEGIAAVAPYALGVHAKTRAFAEDGTETTLDMARCVEIVRKAGYDGWWGIEYEGQDDDHEGVVKSKALLERLLAGA